MRAQVGEPLDSGVPERRRVGPPAVGHSFRFGGGAAGIERLHAELVGTSFAPHRHDTYAVGVTLNGVQTFRYRGELRHCLPGQWHILHPDEPHDGAPGTEIGFGYRIVYVDPALVQEALGGQPLPFVADPVIHSRLVHPALGEFLADLDRPLDDVEAAEITTVISDTLRVRSGGRPRPARLDHDAMKRVRAALLDDPAARHTAADLERIAGVDRWTVARQFRAAFGTSPTRFRTLRRLDRARRLMRAGRALSEVAIVVGFADQSHFTRMFKRAFGVTPAAWLAATSDGPSVVRGSGVDRVDDRGHVRVAVSQLEGLAIECRAHVEQRCGDTGPARLVGN